MEMPLQVALADDNVSKSKAVEQSEQRLISNSNHQYVPFSRKGGGIQATFC